MKPQLKEAFVVSRKTTPEGKIIAYIDPSKPENKNTFAHKQIFKDYGAQPYFEGWGNNKKFKFWYWEVGNTKEEWKSAYESKIKPALLKAHAAERATPEESEQSLIATVEALINAVAETPVVTPETATAEAESGDDEHLTPEEKKVIQERLDKFKEQLVNLENDEDYKKIMRVLLAFKNAQGHQYSLTNTLLIWLQNPNAKHVMGRPRWHGYNRTVNPAARKIGIYTPRVEPYRSFEKLRVAEEFLAKLGKRATVDNKDIYNLKNNRSLFMKKFGITLGECDKLTVALRGRYAGGQEIRTAYDISDTTVMAGKEDLAKDIEGKYELKWYNENNKDERVRPLYNALLDYAKSLGISIEFFKFEKGRERGASWASGKITLPENEGNDVDITKTLSHELSHSLLHQKYVSGRDKDLEKYFLGTAEGAAMVEQQAEISAWNLMVAFGFDVKTTSMTYTMLWGADKTKMLKVLDMVMAVVNLQINEVNKRLTAEKQPVPAGGNAQPVINEASASLSPASPVSITDIARSIGAENELQDAMRMQQQKQEELVETFFRIVKTKL